MKRLIHSRTDARRRGPAPVSWMLLATFIVLAAISSTSNAQEPFDHFTTGFILEGAHANVSCERCHTGGTFQGTNPTCVSCHSSIGAVQASARPVDHIASSEICADCHTTSAWSPIAYMDHSSVSGSCGSCHDGVTATGKPPGHPQSSEQCDDCHTGTAWIPVVFDHTGVTSGCSGCHNGFDATGKHADHIQTTSFCEDCHTTTGWLPTVAVDHTQVVGPCSGCHNGVAATGKH
ncbi:MAG: hypothetical protein OEV32_02595, partial [Gammaproteobacteria bacterium]|nr:hypothetical protein [Gammaproteobacteria bacterium]